MASFIFNGAKAKLGDGSIDWNTDTIKVSLHTSSLTPDKDNDVFFSDIGSEISPVGTYVAGGATLTGTSVTQDNTNDRGVYDANDVQWTGVTSVYRYAIVYKSTGVASTSPVIAVLDYGTDQTVTNAVVDIAWPASGVFSLN
jgi:hypothetical protein